MSFRAHKVAVTIEEGLPPVHGDRQKLTQVLVNLVRNAVQASAQWRQIGVEASRKNGQCRLRRRGRGTGRVGGDTGRTCSSPSSRAKARGAWAWACTWPS